MGRKGGSGISGGGGGRNAAPSGSQTVTRNLTSAERVAIVDSTEKAVKGMKSPTIGNAAILDTNGLTAVVRKERNVGRGGGTFFDVSVWDGDSKIYNVARDSWTQAKDTLYTRLPQFAVAKVQGR